MLSSLTIICVDIKLMELTTNPVPSQYAKQEDHEGAFIIFIVVGEPENETWKFIVFYFINIPQIKKVVDWPLFI